VPTAHNNVLLVLEVGAGGVQAVFRQGPAWARTGPKGVTSAHNRYLRTCDVADVQSGGVRVATHGAGIHVHLYWYALTQMQSVF